MLLLSYDRYHSQRTHNLRDCFHGSTAFLIGGAPTLKQQPIQRLQERGLLVAAMNNAAKHFRPQLWFSSDNPACFEPRILLDPGIMKFASAGHNGSPTQTGKKFNELPNIYFYVTEPDLDWGTILDQRMTTPWFGNTLLVAVVILYELGCRRIILGGSDFELTGGQAYAHETALSTKERNLNQLLYATQVTDLKKLKPVFDEKGLSLIDCSYSSKLGDTYQVLSMDAAIDLALSEYPKSDMDSKALPHGTVFAPPELKQRLGLNTDPTKAVEDVY